MIPVRDSPADTKNALLKESEPVEGVGNLDWFKGAGETGGILLLGGNSIVDFRLRVAQSQLRSDLSPSYWSLCGLIVDGTGTFWSVPLLPPDVSSVPKYNAVQECQLSDYEAEDWPNVAVLRFARDPHAVLDFADRVRNRRSIIDLPELLLAWLGFGWAAGNADNPLLHGRGIPSAAFVETAYALAGIELTPGLSSAASCPEAIWQAVKWWHDYYAEAEKVSGDSGAGVMVPEGQYVLRQKSAAVKLPKDAPLFIPPREPAATPPACMTPRRTTRSRSRTNKGRTKA